jgi:hypothetical protein
MVASILACRPVHNAWSAVLIIKWSAEISLEMFSGIVSRNCHNMHPIWIFSTAFNLVADAFIWILPIPFFLNLRAMPVKRRLELIAIFSIGMAAIAASAIRLSDT